MVFFSSIGTAVAQFADPCCISCDFSYDFVCRIKHTHHFRLLILRRHEPLFQALPASGDFIKDPFFCQLYINLRNRDFIFCFFLQYSNYLMFFCILQVLLDRRRIDLQAFYETSQIFDQPVLEDQKFLRFHHLLRFHTVQLTHIILIILIETDEIAAQIIPPAVDFFRFFVLHLRDFFQIHADPLQKCRLQGRTFDKQIFYPDHHSLDFYCRF